MKCRYKLNSLDCANCAKKIEDALNKEESINKAVVNFAKLTIVVDSDNKDIKKIVQDVVKKVDSDVKVLDEFENNKNNIKFDLIRLILGIILFILSMFIHVKVIHNILIILSYAVLLFRVVKKAILMLIKSFSIDENLLVSISCIGAYFTNNIHEGLMVIILYEMGKILEGLAVNNSRKSIGELMDIKPE